MRIGIDRDQINFQKIALGNSFQDAIAAAANAEDFYCDKGFFNRRVVSRLLFISVKAKFIQRLLDCRIISPHNFLSSHKIFLANFDALKKYPSVTFKK